MRIQITILIIVIISLISACAKKNMEVPQNTKNEIAISGTWTLIQLGEDKITNKSQDKQPSITLDTSQNSITGYSGCNRLNGTISQLSNNKIKFGPIASTKRMCADPNLESRFLKAFDQIVSYVTTDKEIQFLDQNGSVLLNFEKVPVKG